MPTLDLGKVKGEDGVTPNIQVGTVTTLSPGANATVSRRAGSSNAAPVFDFGIPGSESISLPLSTANGGTGNTTGYITAGKASGSTLGTKATAEGFGTAASGDYSHAEGISTIASGIYSHAEGDGSTASDIASHAEGTGTAASGIYSHAEGFGTIASGIYSHAEGNSTIASDEASHAEGFSATASGKNSHAEGNDATASGENAHAEGHGTAASEKASHAEGGNYSKSGTALAPRSVTANDTVYTIRGSQAAGIESHAEGAQTLACGYAAHAEGFHTTASGGDAHAEGNRTTASGEDAHAEGFRTTASGVAAHTEGDQTTASGEAAHAEGYQTTASGEDAHAEGFQTTASNFASHVSGKNSKAMTDGGTARNTVGDVFVIGNGTESATLSNAFRVTYAGDVLATKAFRSSGADYAEYFEWFDGNPDGEDRVGLFVTTKGKQIKIAQPGDYVLGIISGLPCIVGNSDEDWLGRWVRDEFGRIVLEYLDENGEVTDEKTDSWRLKQNPDYNPEQAYIPREQRQEWDAVGMLGVLSVRDDGSCAEDGFCTVGENGIAVAADEYTRNSWRVIERVSPNIVKVIFK